MLCEKKIEEIVRAREGKKMRRAKGGDVRVNKEHEHETKPNFILFFYFSYMFLIRENGLIRDLVFIFPLNNYNRYNKKL